MSQVSRVSVMPVPKTAAVPRATSPIVTSPVAMVAATLFAAWLVLFRGVEGLVARAAARAEALRELALRTVGTAPRSPGSGAGVCARVSRCPTRSRALAAGLLGAAVWLGVVGASLLGMFRGLP